MYEYSVKQKVLCIDNVKVGGLPGKNPTVLIGSIFYTNDKLVEDPNAGDFDKKQTETQLNQMIDVSERTGIPSMLDVVATSPEAMRKYLLYLVDATESPLLIDGSDSVEVNMAGVKLARDQGFLDRVVLNSITPNTEGELLTTVADSGLKSAIILTFSTDAMTSAVKRVELADSLIAKAHENGIENLLIDTGVADLLTLGIACTAQQRIKDKYGLPVGCGAHNAVSTWRGLVPKFGKEARHPAMVGSNLMPVVLGADFVMFGPLKYAKIVFPSVAMIDVALSGILLERRERPEKPHPRYLIS